MTVLPDSSSKTDKQAASLFNEHISAAPPYSETTICDCPAPSPFAIGVVQTCNHKSGAEHKKGVAVQLGPKQFVVGGK